MAANWQVNFAKFFIELFIWERDSKKGDISMSGFMSLFAKDMNIDLTIKKTFASTNFLRSLSIDRYGWLFHYAKKIYLRFVKAY